MSIHESSSDAKIYPGSSFSAYGLCSNDTQVSPDLYFNLNSYTYSSSLDSEDH